ncbi:MAG TPA: hypothetical protein VIK53_07505 [Verrucomicrobiae bacterium]
MSDELAKAARNLEERFQILNLPVSKIPRADWDALPEEIRSLIPSWIPALLSDYSLAGAWLEFENNREQPYPTTFAFLWPENFAGDLKAGSEYRDLIQYGLLPFAYEEGSGSVWVATIANGASGKIYLLEHTAWDGDMPTDKNGLVFAHENLARLLTAMAVSNANFSHNDGVWGR